jgi:hypothetical protein
VKSVRTEETKRFKPNSLIPQQISNSQLISIVDFIVESLDHHVVDLHSCLELPNEPHPLNTSLANLLEDRIVEILVVIRQEILVRHQRFSQNRIASLFLSSRVEFLSFLVKFFGFWMLFLGVKPLVDSNFVL